MPDKDGPTRTIVLLGAGASVDAGLPATSELHERLCEMLDPLYANLGDLLFPGGDVDVEELFRVIEFIHSVETEFRPEEQRSVHESVSIARLVKQWRDPLQEYFDAQRNVVSGTPTGDLIDSLRKALRQLLWLAPMDQHDLTYLRDLILAMKGSTICTLNYDNTIEKIATFGTFQVEADPYPWDQSQLIPGMAARENTIRLIKLHGSLDWSTGPDGVVQRLIPDINNEDYVPGIIFGAGNKLRPTGPFLDLYAEFRTTLDRATRVIIIGYGFGDPHVNELLRRWIQYGSDPGRLFRISRLEGFGVPKVVEEWDPGGHRVQLEMVIGRAAEKMEDLLRKTPGLQVSQRDGEK